MTHLLLAEIDLADAWIAGDLLRRALAEKRAVDQHRDRLGAPAHRPFGDVFAAVEDLAGCGTQHAGELVDEGRLAGAIGADEGVARALRQREVDVVGGDDSAERLAELARLENDRHAPSPL